MPQKTATIKRHRYPTLPHGKGVSQLCSHNRSERPCGWRSKQWGDHDAPNSHWQAAFFKIFPTPRFCMDEALVVPSWGVMVPECTLSYAPQSGLKPRPAPCAHTSGPSPGMPGYTGLSSKNQRPEAPSPESGSEESKGVQEL